MKTRLANRGYIMLFREFELEVWLRFTLSLFNLMVLLWLGLTVFLNAERREWGIYMASGGLMLGAAFFASHTALWIVGFGFTRTSAWWFFLGMVPVIILPVVWYMTVLWYAGYWSGGKLRLRQRWWFTAVLGVMLFGLVDLVAKAFRTTFPFDLLNRVMDISVFNIQLDAFGYMLYVVLCIGLSVDAIRFPAPTHRIMGDQARTRARPWIITAAIALSGTAVMVILAIGWILQNARVGVYYVLDERVLSVVSLFDIVIMVFIAIATLSVGQAITRYELFTGRTLPRQGLRTYWRRAVIFSAAFSAVISVAIATDSILIYSVLLTIILMTSFLALLGSRSYKDRDRLFGSLRPFVSGQKLYDSMLVPREELVADAQAPFEALCSDVLGCERAYLMATGAFAPLVADLAFGDSAHSTGSGQAQSLPPDRIDHLISRFDSPTTLFAPLKKDDPYDFAIPLWSERGLIGLLLVGAKRGDGLYSQEEIEIARATGERLIDVQAGANVATRLMQLQRERMVQNLVIDRHSRRVLHDEVLPLIQTAMIGLSAGAEAQESVALLTDAHQQISELLHEMPMVATPDVARLGLVGALQRVVETEFGGAFDQVIWAVEPGIENRLKQWSGVAAETTFYAAREMIRNAAKYARHPKRDLVLRISAASASSGQAEISDQIYLKIADNGVGLKQGEGGKKGHGMALHSTLMAVVGGSLVAESRPNESTTVTLTLPTDGATFAD